jgi:hypothetical protein
MCTIDPRSQETEKVEQTEGSNIHASIKTEYKNHEFDKAGDMQQYVPYPLRVRNHQKRKNVGKHYTFTRQTSRLKGEKLTDIDTATASAQNKTKW